MNDQTQQGDGSGPSQRKLEIAAALGAAAFGALIAIGSMKVGINWGADGPKPGFFPFYISLFIIGASAINLYKAMQQTDAAGGVFATWEELGRVLAVVAPLTAYVAIMPFVGIYVSSFLLIGLFMLWIGRYSWLMTLPVALGIPVCVFVVFEFWFQIALPKGPLENWLGL